SSTTSHGPWSSLVWKAMSCLPEVWNRSFRVKSGSPCPCTLLRLILPSLTSSSMPASSNKANECRCRNCLCGSSTRRERTGPRGIGSSSGLESKPRSASSGKSAACSRETSVIRCCNLLSIRLDDSLEDESRHVRVVVLVLGESEALHEVL